MPPRKKQDIGYNFQRSRSGWCLSGHDKECPRVFHDGECTCECHINLDTAIPN